MLQLEHRPVLLAAAGFLVVNSVWLIYATYFERGSMIVFWVPHLTIVGAGAWTGARVRRRPIPHLLYLGALISVAEGLSNVVAPWFGLRVDGLDTLGTLILTILSAPYVVALSLLGGDIATAALQRELH